jgi:hypothetical protein
MVLGFYQHNFSSNQAYACREKSCSRNLPDPFGTGGRRVDKPGNNHRHPCLFTNYKMKGCRSESLARRAYKVSPNKPKKLNLDSLPPRNKRAVMGMTAVQNQPLTFGCRKILLASKRMHKGDTIKDSLSRRTSRFPSYLPKRFPPPHITDQERFEYDWNSQSDKHPVHQNSALVNSYFFRNCPYTFKKYTPLLRRGPSTPITVQSYLQAVGIHSIAETHSLSNRIKRRIFK